MDPRKFKLIYGGAINSMRSLEEEQADEEERLAREEARKQAFEEAEKIQEEDSKPKKNLLDHAGEAAVGVGNFIKDAAVDAYKTAESSIGGLANVTEGAVASQEQRRRVGEESDIAEKTQQELQKVLGSDFENSESSKWDSPEVKAIIERGNKQLADFKSANREKEAGAEKQMQEAQDVDAKKVAADTAETFLNVGTLGTGTAVKAAAKQGGKQLLKAAARGAGEGAVFGAAAGGTDAISEGMEADDAVANIATGAAFGGLLGGASSGIGAAFQAKKAGKLINENATTPTADTAAVSDTQFSKITDEELTNQIDQFQSNARTDDTGADYKRYQELKDELDFRTNQKEKAAFESNGLPNDVKGAEAALAKLDAGELPETAYKPRQADVESVAQIFADKDMPVEIRNAAQEVMDDQGKVNTMLDGLMNDQKYENSHIAMDQAYNARLREIQQFPEPRYIAEREKLDAQYKDDLAELEFMRSKDLPEVEQWNSVLDTLEAREQQIVGDTNILIEKNPDAFRVPDENEVAAQRQLLVDNLEQAKRFNEPDKIIQSTASAANPQKAYDRNPDAQPAYNKSIADDIDKMDNTEAVRANYKGLTDVQLAAARTNSPSQWLENMGLRNESIDLHTKVIRSKEAENAANEVDSKILGDIAKNLPQDKNAVNQIWDYLQGKRKTLDIGNEQVAKQIRELLDAKRAELEKLGFKTLDDYMPHVFDKNDPQVQRLFQGKVTGEINANNLKHRVMDSDDYSRDTLDVLATYLTSVNRKIHLEPALKDLDNVKVQVDMAVGEAKLIDDYITQLKGFNHSAIGDAYNKGMDAVFKKVGLTNQAGKNHYSATLSVQRMISAVATMGLNPGTAIRNLTQAVNTIADIGPVWSTAGSVDGLRMLATKAGRDELKRAGIFDGSVSKSFYDAITSTGVKGRLNKGVEASTRGLMSLIHMTDVSLRAQAYAGAKMMAKSKGLEGKAAEDFAIRKVVDTQFVTSVVDMPLAFNGQGVRSLTQLATFSGKQLGFLKRTGMKVIKDRESGKYRLDPKQLMSVLSAATVAAIATEQLKPVIGFREEEWIPFYDQVAPFLPEEALNAVGLEKTGGDSLYRSPLVRLLAGDGRSKIGLIQALQGTDSNGDDKVTMEEGMNEFMKDNWSQIIPAGTQIKKTQEGVKTTTGLDLFTGEQGQAGESRNDSGNIRYLQDMDQGSVWNAALYGQYSTESGRNWIEEGFPTLSKTETERVDAQDSREEKERYADFYTALKQAGGRTKAYEEVKSAALVGNQTRAAKAAKEYNDKLTAAEAEYRAKYKELPKELQDELDSRRISVSKVIKNARE